MSVVFRPISGTYDIGTAANTVADSKIVYIFNNSATPQTIKINGANTVMVASYASLVLEKATTDTVLCISGIATAVKYRG